MAATLTVVIGESGCMGTCSICDPLGWAVIWLGEGGDVLCRAWGVEEDGRYGSCQSTGGGQRGPEGGVHVQPYAAALVYCVVVIYFAVPTAGYVGK